MKVVVTGQDGYLGTIVSAHLSAAGLEYDGIDTFAVAECQFGKHDASPAVGRGDIRSVRATDLAGVHTVIHLAAVAGDEVGAVDPEQTFDINHAGTVRLAQAAAEAGVRHFLFVSSQAVYGDRGDALLTEDDETRPATAYAESKLRAERDLQSLAESDDTAMRTTVIRVGSLFGTSRRLRTDTVVNELVALAHTTGTVPLDPARRSWTNVLHVEDAATALLAVIGHRSISASETPSYTCYNLGREDQNFRRGDLAEELVDLVPRTILVQAANDAPLPSRSTRVSCARFAERFGSLPFAWSLERGVADLLAAFRQHGIAPEHVTGPRFSRVAQARVLDGLRLAALRAAAPGAGPR